MRQSTVDYASEMFGRRNASKDIWRAVVMAGAMLGAGAGCGGPSASSGSETTPVENTGGVEGVDTEPASTGTDTTDPSAGMVEGDNPCQAVADDNPCGEVANPCGDDNPCADDGWEEGDDDDRIRGSGDSGGVGRGFILA